MSNEVEKALTAQSETGISNDGLLPCPFCGGDAEVHEWDWNEGKGKEFSIRCTNLRCSATAAHVGFNACGGEAKRALEYGLPIWNTRALTAQSDAVALPKEDFERVKAILLGIDTYLDRNKLNYIASTSIWHKEIKETLSILEKEYKTMTEWQSVPKNMGERLGEDFLKALFSSDYDTPYVERVNAMLEAAPKPEPDETVEGLTEALKNCDEYAHGRYDVDIKVIEAARLWLRKQGE